MNAPDSLPQYLQPPAVRRAIARQRAQLEMFADLDAAMQPLWTHCAALRRSSSITGRRIPVNGPQLRQIVTACELGLLAQIREADRPRVEREAADGTALRLTALRLDALGDLALPAHAETGLRMLTVFTLRSARDVWSPEQRWPGWEEAIRTATSKLATTSAAWRACLRAHHTGPDF